MSQSIDFRINDFINEYLDYKGYKSTLNTFSEERQIRKEPINKTNHENLYEQEKEKYNAIKVINYIKISFFILYFFN